MQRNKNCLGVLQMELNKLVKDVKRLLDEKGFPYDQSTFYEKVALLHTEVSELTDVIKKKGYGAQEEIEEEIADIFLRAMNFALMFDFDLEEAIARKMMKNWQRPFKYNTFEEEKR
jgi:NTP pyrophosphatase (non-canonical NTP hydrolase)